MTHRHVSETRGIRQTASGEIVSADEACRFMKFKNIAWKVS